MYEQMPLSKIQKLIKAHNAVQDEMKKQLNGGGSQTQNGHFVGVKPTPNQ